MIIFSFECIYIFFLLFTNLSYVFNIEIDLKLVRIAKSFTNSKNYIDNDFFYTIPIFIGTEPQSFEVLYETNFTHLYINSNPRTMTHNFNTSLSSTLTITPGVTHIYEFRGPEVEDVVMFGMNEFRCSWIFGYYAPDYYSFFDGLLGFGYQYTPSDNNEENDLFDKKFSILEHLYQLNKNPKRLFGHKYFNENKYLRLYLGEINDEEYLTNTNYPRCSSVAKRWDLKHKWTCVLKEITMSPSGSRLNITGQVVFSTGSNLITGPNETGIKLIDEIIKDQGANCNKYYVSDIKTSFRCTSAIDLRSLPVITFRLNGVDLTVLPLNYVYKEYNIRGDGFIYKSRIELNTNEDYWCLGQPILRGLSMVFNEDDGTVGFWNLYHSRNYKREIWVILGISVIVSSIILVVILFNIRQRDKKLKLESALLNEKNKSSFNKIDMPSNISSTSP